MLPRETVEAIARLAVNAAPRTVQCQAEPPDVYYTVGPDGTLTRQVAGRGALVAASLDFNTVCDYAILAKADAAQGEDFINPEVWYSRNAVVAVLDKDVRRDRVTFALTPSPQFDMLARWEKSPGIFKQAAIILLLRTLFVGSLPDHPGLVDVFRKLNCKQGKEVAADLQRGKVSMSRDMLAQVTGDVDIPAEVRFRVPIFAEAGAKGIEWSVRVAIEPDAEHENFHFYTLPGQTESAYGAAEDMIRGHLENRLKEGGIPVYYGSP